MQPMVVGEACVGYLSAALCCPGVVELSRSKFNTQFLNMKMLIRLVQN